MIRAACGHAGIVVCAAVLCTLVVEGCALEVGNGLGEFGCIGLEAIVADAGEAESDLTRD